MHDAAKGVLFDLDDNSGGRGGSQPVGPSGVTAWSGGLPQPDHWVEEVEADSDGPARIVVHISLPMIGGAAEADLDMGSTMLKVICWL